ncbi:MAG: low molecular weight protein-tyrosine-phosphatase [Mariprofundaceae bacterium]|nr:low molecular weight protein-tyrosine-phosphatase [Mariprofundaceae bacterium]
MINSVLMVCVGNICRSPMAEVLAKDLFEKAGKKIDIASAGIAALVDHPADLYAIEVVDAMYGLDLSQHQGQQLTRQVVSGYDLILTMEKGHVEDIHRLFPQFLGRVHLVGKWNGDEEVFDPYKKPKYCFEDSLEKIRRGINAWLRYL